MAGVLVFSFVLGMFMTRYPMTVLRHLLTKKQWEQFERVDPASVSAVVRLIGIGWIVGVLVILFTAILTRRG